MKEKLPEELSKKVNVVSEYQGHSSFRLSGDEKPRAFFINNEKITVVETLDMWIEESLPDKTRKRFFIVKGNDNQKHKIYTDERTLEWFCEMK